MWLRVQISSVISADLSSDIVDWRFCEFFV
jgi:hypothetical protein